MALGRAQTGFGPRNLAYSLSGFGENTCRSVPFLAAVVRKVSTDLHIRWTSPVKASCRKGGATVEVNQREVIERVEGLTLEGDWEIQFNVAFKERDPQMKWFGKGKRVLANRPVTERNVELEREEVRTLPHKLVTEYIELSEALQQFAEENSDGTIKVCEKGIKAIFKKLKKDDAKKPDVDFPLNAKWEEFQQTQKSVFKYLSKEFLREHWKEVLTSGILKSRSIVNSKDFLVSGISKVGIMSAININVTDIIPSPTAVKAAGTYKDYYWLLVNAKESLKPSDVFNRREAITRHPRYVAVNARNQWELCKQNLAGDSELINIWKELLDSRFMFDIIMCNVHANPLIEPCLNELFNESAELFKTVLKPISFVFNCSFLGPITGDLKTTLRNSQDIYAYDKYSWLHKVNHPSDNCVCDIVQVGGH